MKVEKYICTCPICGSKIESDIPDAQDEICDACGWHMDPIQNEDPNEDGGPNELSLNQYKKEYNDKIKKDPKYHWWKYRLKEKAKGKH